MARTKTTKADRDALLYAAVDAYAPEKEAADARIAAEHDTGALQNTVNFSVRLPTDLAVHMRKAAAAEHLPTSAWLRRTIINALQPATTSDEHIERVVRRILAENTSTP